MPLNFFCIPAGKFEAKLIVPLSKGIAISFCSCWKLLLLICFDRFQEKQLTVNFLIDILVFKIE